jgi:dihydroorotate dehydrogenase
MSVDESMWEGAYRLTRGGLFRLDAEQAHHLTLAGLCWAERAGWLRAPAWSGGEVTVMGLRFPNRLGLAAGMDKTGKAVDGFGALGFGHIEVGTVTPRPQPGNPAPRLFRLIRREAIINRMGFNNPGLEAVVRNLQRRRSFRGILGVNLGKNFDTPNEVAVQDYLAGLRAVYPVADYVAINLSSPNTKGLRELQGVEAFVALFEPLLEERESLRREHGVYRPLAVKVAPDLTMEQTGALAEAVNRLQLDAVIATNTTIDRAAVAGEALAGEEGGLSGKPLAPRALECLRIWRGLLGRQIPLIGVGGIMSGAEARERLAAGAALVQIYTGLVYRGPGLVREILRVTRDLSPERDGPSVEGSPLPGSSGRM